MIATLKPWDERKSARGQRRCRGGGLADELSSYPEGIGIVFVIRPFRAWARPGWFPFELQDRKGSTRRNWRASPANFWTPPASGPN